MKKFYRMASSFALLIFFAMNGFTQSSESVDPALNKVENAYMDRQAEAFLHQIDQTLTANPPGYPEPEIRSHALLLLDAVLHDKYAAFRKPVQAFYKNRMAQAVDEIERTKVNRGAVIWKLYNMGFIVRTPGVTLAFDLVSGESSRSEQFALHHNVIQRLVDQCDVLFISHRHRDHVDKWIASAFVKAGKPVVAPPQVWEGEPEHKLITKLRREAHTVQELSLPKRDMKLKVVVYPGHQMSSHQNNVPLVYTPEGITVSHMGDQINEGDFMVDYAWIDQISMHHKTHILLPNNWTNDIYRIVKGFDPELVIPGHENELGHPVDDRVPFWGDEQYLELEYSRLKKSHYPVVVMAWGERYHYVPKVEIDGK